MGKKGSALVWAVSSMLILAVVAAAVLTMGGVYAHRSIRDNSSRQAYLTARSAVDAMIAQLEQEEGSTTLVPAAAGSSQAVSFTVPDPLPGQISASIGREVAGGVAYALLSATAIVGEASETVKARMKLAEGGGGGGGDSPVWDYRIFAGNTIDCQSGNMQIGGSIHSNGSVNIGWSQGRISGNAEAVTSFSIQGPVTEYTRIFPAAVIPMPDFSGYVESVKIPDIVMPGSYAIHTTGSALKSDSRQNWNQDMYVTGDVTVDHGVDITSNVYITDNLTVREGVKVTGNLYVEGYINFESGGAEVVDGYVHADGNMTVKASRKLTGNLYAGGDISFPNGSDIEGNVYAKGNITANGFLTMKGTLSAGGAVSLPSGAKIGGNLFANGDIVFNSGLTADPAAALCVYSAHGNINNRVHTIGTINGVIYAPEGTVALNENVTFNGSIVGKTVTGYAGNLIMGECAFDFPFLGGGDSGWEFVRYE